MRLFTPDEANAALGRVRPLAERLVELRRELVELQGEHRELRGKVAGNGASIDAEAAGGLEERIEAATAALAETIEAIVAAGAQVKDLDSGLLDFPARHPDGATVLLCWRVGEDEIAYWHGLEEGFAGRKPLPF